ncbi:MAG: TldD/PmbA family protein [Clostridia bacterium]
MQKQLESILSYLKDQGVDYADIRVHDTVSEEIATENQSVMKLSTDYSKGFGIRVFYQGALGFASSHDLKKMERAADKAIEIAKASALTTNTPVKLTEKEMTIDNYTSPYKIDPFDVSKEEKLDLLFAAEKTMQESADLIKTSGFLQFKKENKTFADTDGSYIRQTIIISGGGIQAFAASENDMQTRSYPNSARGNYLTAGYEYIKDLDFIKNAALIAKEAEELVNAPECPSGTYDLVIDGTQLFLQIHESVGHPTELDRILGYEAGYAGTSFLSPDMLDEFEYGSEHVNIVADATSPKGLGTFAYDDEGIKAQKTPIILEGIFKGVTSSRDTASEIGKNSSGAARASGWNRIPLVRMTNINLLPGKYSLEELIEDINDGLLLKTNKSWSIDDKRLNFQFATEIAYEIKNGELTGKIYKNPIYSGISYEFWRSCDGVANKDHWVMYGTPNCGKGEPTQVMHVGHGCAPARFRNVKVGVSNNAR